MQTNSDGDDDDDDDDDNNNDILLIITINTSRPTDNVQYLVTAESYHD